MKDRSLSYVIAILAITLIALAPFSGNAGEESPSSEQVQPLDKSKKITIHFPDTDIRVALATLSAKVGVSIIAGPEVTGKVSIKLEGVPWERGLDILLKTYGYAYVWEEGIIRVMSRENFLKLEVQTKVYSLQYADVLEVQKAVAVVLSKEGAAQVSVDTKTIIVKESPENQKNIAGLIEGFERLSREKRRKVDVEEPDQSPPTPVGQKNLVLDFINTPIRDAVAQISALSGVYISVGEEVQSVVTLSTAGKEVPWQKALAEIIRTTDLAHVPADVSIESLEAGDFLSLRSKEKILEKYETDEKIAERVGVMHKVIFLKYLDGEDVKKILETQLTARGKITILEVTGQTGWTFSRETATKLAIPERASEKKPSKSRIVLISDIPSSVEKMLSIIAAIDIMPHQIIIETKIVEVDRDVLRDLGLEVGSGTTGATDTSVNEQILKRSQTTDVVQGGFFNQSFDTAVTPDSFTPLGSGITPVNSGLQFELTRLTNFQLNFLIHALEEDVGANIVSAPKVITMNNQEAVIVVGEQFPIVTTEITTGTTSTTSVKLEYYQDIGVRLNVVPQVSDDKYINMILHPSVTTRSSTLTIFNTGGFQIAQYPILTTREAETQLLMRDGETIVLGGLLQDNVKESTIGIPFLQSLPFIGPVFSRKTTDVDKLDLLIFVNAQIVDKSSSEAGYLPSDYFGNVVSSAPQRVVNATVDGAR